MIGLIDDFLFAQSVQSPASLQVPSTYQEKFSPSSQALLSPSNVFTDEGQCDAKSWLIGLKLIIIAHVSYYSYSLLG